MRIGAIFSESSCVMMIMRSLEPNLLDRSRSASSEAVQPLFDEWKNTRYERSAAAGFRDASQVTLLSSGARSPMTMFCAWDAPNVQKTTVRSKRTRFIGIVIFSEDSEKK
mgnify:FL=1